MNLYNMNITLGQLLKNPEARKVLTKEFPSLSKTPLINLHSNTPIRQIIAMSKNIVGQEKINRIIKELENI